MSTIELSWDFIQSQLPAGWRELAVEMGLIRPAASAAARQDPRHRTDPTAGIAPGRAGSVAADDDLHGCGGNGPSRAKGIGGRSERWAAR